MRSHGFTLDRAAAWGWIVTAELDPASTDGGRYPELARALVSTGALPGYFRGGTFNLTRSGRVVFCYEFAGEAEKITLGDLERARGAAQVVLSDTIAAALQAQRLAAAVRLQERG